MLTESPDIKKTALVTQLMTVLSKVPAGDRSRFARSQLSTKYPRLVSAFEAIPPARRNSTVLFVSLNPHTRETRLAAAARLAGWVPFHVCTGPAKFVASEFFPFHAQLDDLISLTLACWLFPGALVHVFALKGHHALLLGLLKPRRLVVDLYDTCGGDFADSASNVDQEQQLLARCDGITHRDLRIKHLQKANRRPLPQHNIFIHDPLIEVKATEQTKRETGEIHIISAGWVGSGDSSVMRVAKALCAHSIHLHIYFNPFQGEGGETQPYRDYQQENPFFHIENTVYGSRYLDELKKYDFGLAVVEPAIFGEPISNFTADALASCGSSRLSDYIAADLGIIISSQLKFQYFWARRFGAATVSATREFLANPKPILERALLDKKSRFPNRSTITISGTAKRLGEFYTRVAS